MDSLQMAIPNLDQLPQDVIERKSQAMLDALVSLKPGAANVGFFNKSLKIRVSLTLLAAGMLPVSC